MSRTVVTLNGEEVTGWRRYVVLFAGGIVAVGAMLLALLFTMLVMIVFVPIAAIALLLAGKRR